MKLCLHVALLGLGFLSSVALAQPTPTETELCNLLAHPTEFNNKLVRVRARVESTVIEGGTWLEGAACTPNGVELVVPDHIRKHPEQHLDFKAFDDAIRLQGNLGTVDKEITATFIGVFTARRKRSKRSLTLEKVENLSVHKLQGK